WRAGARCRGRGWPWVSGFYARLRGEADGHGGDPGVGADGRARVASPPACTRTHHEGAGMERGRARDLGVVIGTYPPGPRNAVTDVEGVRVGHRTIVREPPPDGGSEGA